MCPDDLGNMRDRYLTSGLINLLVTKGPHWDQPHLYQSWNNGRGRHLEMTPFKGFLPAMRGTPQKELVGGFPDIEADDESASSCKLLVMWTETFPTP